MSYLLHLVAALGIDVPSAETLKGYETLTTVGILLLVLGVFGGAVMAFLIWLFRLVSSAVKEFAGRHLIQMETQSTTLLLMNEGQKQLKETVQGAQKSQADRIEGWHRRLDELLRCYHPSCPMKTRAPDPPQ